MGRKASGKFGDEHGEQKVRRSQRVSTHPTLGDSVCEVDPLRDVVEPSSFVSSSKFLDPINQLRIILEVFCIHSHTGISEVLSWEGGTGTPLPVSNVQ